MKLEADIENKKELGMYIHIPFCQKKCNYCDFCSYSNKNALVEPYMQWLNTEIKEVGRGNTLDYKNGMDKLAVIDTIYIGGGTPSYIDSSYIVNIMKTINSNYYLASHPEITIEVNPGTVTEQKLQDYKKAGINRLSIGLQSTHNNLLKQLGRIHTYEQFKTTYQLARKAGFNNINIDIMIGLPNQTIQDVEDTIKTILDLEPEHISVYSLILEEGTKLYQDVQIQKYSLPTDEEERDMYWTAKNMLEQAGYNHYEISNFAKPTYESKHNLNCWEQKEYIGMGVAAHSYTNNIRYSNVDSIETYIQNYQNNHPEDNLIFHEKQNKQSAMSEYMLLGLRKIQGISIQKFKEQYTENPIYTFRKELEKLVKQELIEIDGDAIKLTTKGIDLANLVWEEFV